MNFKSLKTDFTNGILFAIPLGIVFYLFVRILKGIENLVKPVATQIGVTRLLGQFTLTIFALALIFLFCLILGLMLKRAAFLRAMGDSIEGVAVRILPSLSVISSMAKEQMEIDSSDNWRGALIGENNTWAAGFLIEENDKWQTIYLPEPPKGEGGEIRIVAKGSVDFIFINISDVRTIMRLHGQGALQFLAKRETGAL